jgi:hypothetical protein
LKILKGWANDELSWTINFIWHVGIDLWSTWMILGSAMIVISENWGVPKSFLSSFEMTKFRFGNSHFVMG